eukprot:CAMPEP_0206420920 /NCGR_PEP_ID=MMETSP0324_2-20121206/1154_1 /ASSEMBLY_ACC=CAM_ASM_000836 /TAXON_ID=2866 /ORGANISM="Crypthecodinium cohnii, Strain Seligo" /LENGTH=237 /DNA_ID=CAMNT_0053884945 /DNA_START=92 /DNA_END=805 /DNA_ORIENTATION=-
MAAGITTYYDLGGGQTADLIQNQWPLRPGERRPNDFSATSQNIGRSIHCHAESSYRPPEMPAGTSKRMGAFYEKTGTMKHRMEPGFREIRGFGTVTELPAEGYGTMRRANATGGSRVLTNTGNSISNALKEINDGVSVRSRRSAASQATTRSARSNRSQLSAPSVAPSSVPSWAARAPAPAPWNFDALPMYQKTNDAYGSGAKQAREYHGTKAAGKSESGFLEPSKLIETLTRPNPA